MVSTITECFFVQKSEPLGQEKLCLYNWSRLSAAVNGLAILYVGYFELDVQLCGQFIAQRGC